MARESQDIYGNMGSVPNETAVNGSGAQPNQTRANPDEFGAQVGAGLQRVGQAGEGLAKEFGDIYNDSSARERTVTASQKLSDLENEYRQNRGLNAADAYKTFQQKSQQLYNESADGLTLGAQQIFKNQFSRELAYSQKSAGMWAADQTYAAQNQSLDAGIGNNVNLMAAANGDTQRLTELSHDIHDMSIQRAHADGLPIDSANQLSSKNVGMGWDTAIRTTMKTDPDKAQELYKIASTGSFTETKTDGTTVKIPYMDAQQQAQTASMMYEIAHRQAGEAMQGAHMDAMLGRPYDKPAIVQSLSRAGYGKDYIDAETGRLDALSGSAKQKQSDFTTASTGQPVRNNPFTSDVLSQIDTQAKQIGVPLDVAHAVAVQESGGRMNPPGSNDGGKAVGIFQLHEGAAQDTGVDRNTTEGNIKGGLTYLKQQYDKFGSWDKAIAAYNAGPTALTNAGGDITKLPAGSQKYLADVNTRRRLDPQQLIDRADGDPQNQYQIARNLTALTPLSDDAQTISKTSGVAQDIMQNAFDVKSQMLSPRGDPAGYVMTHNDLLHGAQGEALSKPNDKMQDGQTNLAYYIKTLDGAYDSIGQPLNNRPILSKDYGQQVVSKIIGGGMGGAQKTFDTMQQQYGDNFQRVYNDLVRNGLPAQFQVMANIDDPMMKSRLASAYSIPDQKTSAKEDKFWQEALGGKGNQAPKTMIDAAIDKPDSPLTTYLTTLKASGAQDSDIASYRGVIKRLAYENKLNGDDSDTAAKNAVSALTGKYSYGFDKARIPSTVASVVERNANNFRDNLKADDLMVPSYAESPENYVYSIQHAGQYITNTDETGLNLKDQSGRLVRGKDGNPIVIPFAMKAKKGLPAPEEAQQKLSFGSWG